MLITYQSGTMISENANELSTMLIADDPKLICREMAESRQSAAGLSIRDRTRHARSACYQNVVTLNIFVIFTGVIIALLLLGKWNCLGAYIFSSGSRFYIINVSRFSETHNSATLPCFS